ncbi:MAG: PEP-CTERM sorting domain-containing protein [Rubrivivax sp.]|nr:PEP-CTERM sorting domain-containing protein [Rubrivivax sp.]
MKKSLISLAVLAASTFGASSAHALAIVIDSFSQPTTGIVVADVNGVVDRPVAGTGAAGNPLADTVSTGGISAFVTSRSLDHLMDTTGIITANGGVGAAPGLCTVNCGGAFSSAGIGGLPNFEPDRLNMSNGSAIDATVGVTWALGPIVTTSATFTLDVLTNDTGTTTGAVPNTVTWFINGGPAIGTFNIIGTGAGVISFSLNAAQSALLAPGALLRAEFNGSPEWDLSLDNLTLRIPEPGTLALAGLAVLGAGLAARRRKA